jgi:diacylglycerol kinase (ATP)
MNAGLADTREVTLAVIPTGTGNDWARSLGITRDPAIIARTLAAGRTMLHDVGAIDFPDTGGTPPLVHQRRRRGFRRVRHRARAASGALRVHLPRHRAARSRGYQSPQFTHHCRRPDHRGPPAARVRANAQFCGNRMHVAPTARMDDGLLDVLAVRAVAAAGAAEAREAVWRPHPRRPGRAAPAAARVRIATDPPAVIQADGQIIGHTPAEFSLLRRSLTVVTAPAGPSPAGAATHAGTAPRSA